MGGFLKLFGLVTICKWLGKKGKWKISENQAKTQEDKKFLTIEYGLNEWLTIWKKILRWFKVLKLFQQGLCILALITLPIGILASGSLSGWSFGIFGVYVFLTYLIYYIYWTQSKKLLNYQPKVEENLCLSSCKSTVKWTLLLSLLPFIFLFGYKPFEHLNNSISDLIDTETLEKMNPSLFEEKLTKLNKKPEELHGLAISLEEFQKPANVI